MRAIMVMYDSLNRHYLSTYGCNWVHTPNFERLAQKSVQFENNYVGSMPCMPARRELHTGRLSFFHRSWGPIEPFDDSMPEILKRNGVYTHLISDHMHYWEDGGATYHTRYSSWEVSRGQEADNWVADLPAYADLAEFKTVFKGKEKALQRPFHQNAVRQDILNRRTMDIEEKTSQAVTFSSGLDFIRRNHAADQWFLQIETFDPHEPFFTLPDDKALYPHHFTGDADANADWPAYAPVEEDAETVQHVRCNYAALVSKCDRYLGKVLDLMDTYDMWKDTMLIVNTDHGFLLGEHDYWGKSAMPVYEEIAHVPLYIYDPRCPEAAGQKRYALTQTIDLAPTLLDFFALEPTKDMEGKPLKNVISRDEKIRDYAVFGYFGSQINITDGKYLYMHTAEHPEKPLYQYTLMPTHMRCIFSIQELGQAELAEPFSFTKGVPVLKVPSRPVNGDSNSFGSMLFDLEADNTENILDAHPQIAEEMRTQIGYSMRQNDAPKEYYERMGIQ